MKKLVRAGIAGCCLLAAPALAQVGTAEPDTDMDLRFRAGINHTDNLGREADGQSETFLSAGTDLGLSRRGTRIDADLSGSLDYFYYDSDRFDNEFVGRVDGYLGAALVPERLDWIFENRFGQIRTDPFDPEGPDNRENLNVFETGPDVYLPIGDRTFASANARYFDRRFQDSGRLDSDGLSLGGGLTRFISPTQRIGLNASWRRIEFDAPAVLAPSYEVYSLYGSYDRQLATGEVGLDIGGNQLRRAGSSTNGLLVRGRWTRELTPRSTLTFRAGREFQDAGDQLGRVRLEDLLFPEDAATVGQTSDVRTETFFRADYALRRDRATFRLGGGWRQDDYELRTDRDRDSFDLRAGVGYRVTPTLTADLEGRYLHEDFDARDGNADEYRISVGLTQRLGRQFELAFRYAYIERDADFGREFEENRLTLNLIWIPGGR